MYTQIHAHVYTCTHCHIHPPTHMHVCTHTHKHCHICTHQYTHICILTHIYDIRYLMFHLMVSHSIMLTSMYVLINIVTCSNSFKHYRINTNNSHHKLRWAKLHVIVVTWAPGICLICMLEARAEGIHIRQITRAHVTSNMYYF